MLNIAERLRGAGLPPDEGKPITMDKVEGILLEQASRLGGIEAGISAIQEHLRVLNGSTAKSIERITALEHHPGRSELEKDLAVLKADLQAEKAADAAWMKRLWPLIWLFLMFMFGLVLGNADKLKGIIGVKGG